MTSDMAARVILVRYPTSYSSNVNNGSTSSRNDQPSIMADLVGTHPKPSAKVTVSKAAVAICGIEVVKTAMKEMDLSSADPSPTPASTPNVSDTGTMIKKVKKARMAVFARL